MTILGRNKTPPACDPKWLEWCRPLCAWIARSETPRTLTELYRFADAHGSSQGKALDLLSFALNEEMAEMAGPGAFTLTLKGRVWLGDYVLPDADAELAPDRRRMGRPKSSSRIRAGVAA